MEDWLATASVRVVETHPEVCFRSMNEDVEPPPLRVAALDVEPMNPDEVNQVERFVVDVEDSSHGAACLFSKHREHLSQHTGVSAQVNCGRFNGSVARHHVR